MLTTQTNTAPATPPTTATPIASINPVAPFAAKSEIALPGVEEGELEEPAEEGAPEMSAAGLEGVKGAVAVGAAVADRATGNEGGGVSGGRKRRRVVERQEIQEKGKERREEKRRGEGRKGGRTAFEEEASASTNNASAGVRRHSDRGKRARPSE
jgi:hypothetical protein